MLSNKLPSTVSKVLRQKDKYLIPEDGGRSPPRKNKSKFPDIERTLSNWAKNRRAEKLPINDALIRDEARKFASTLGNAECTSQVNDPVWLEKFKAKNHLPGSVGKSPKPSLSPKSGSQTPNASPTVGWDGIPLNPTSAASKTKSPDSVFSPNDHWSHTHSQSTTSLNSCFSESAFSEFRSPTSPYFSPMSSCGPSPGMPAQKVPRLPILAPASLRRRQTVPLIDAESPNSATSTKIPKHPSTMLESPASDMEVSPINMDAPHTHSHSRSGTTGFRAPGSSSNSISPVSPPPTTEEARAALEIWRKFIENQPNGSIDAQDYLVIGKWIQMLKLDAGSLPGGMHSINGERGDGTVPMGRKRSVHSLN